jgi:hypothetical protein
MAIGRSAVGHFLSIVWVCFDFRRRSPLWGQPLVFFKTADGPSHTPAISVTYLPAFFGAFLDVSRQGEFKNTSIFTKSPCRTPSPKKSTKTLMSVFPRLFVLFYHFFRAFFSDENSKTLRKTIYKKIAPKSFYKRIDKKPKTGVFSVRGVQKHHTKYQASDLPTDPRGSPICAFLLAPS